MMRALSEITANLRDLKTELTDAIAATYPVGKKVMIRTKYGWDFAEVVWTPDRANGANPHIYVRRLRTGGKHKIELLGAGDHGSIRSA